VRPRRSESNSLGKIEFQIFVSGDDGCRALRSVAPARPCKSAHAQRPDVPGGLPRRPSARLAQTEMLMSVPACGLVRVKNRFRQFREDCHQTVPAGECRKPSWLWRYSFQPEPAEIPAHDAFDGHAVAPFSRSWRAAPICLSYGLRQRPAADLPGAREAMVRHESVHLNRNQRMGKLCQYFAFGAGCRWA